MMHCRQYQRLLLLDMMSEAELQALKGRYTLTLPLPNHKAARNRLLARGRAQDLPALQQQYPAIPAGIAQKLANEQQGVGVDVRVLDLVGEDLRKMQLSADEERQLQYVALAQQLKQIKASLPRLSAADKPATQLQLLELFEAAARVCSSRANLDLNNEGRFLHLLRFAAACIGGLAVPAAFPGSFQWCAYAAAQVHIRRTASSSQAAKLLLGPDSIEPEHLRWGSQHYVQAPVDDLSVASSFQARSCLFGEARNTI
jgi:hypothetical protein